MVNELLQLSEVHKRHVVDVTEELTLEHNRLGDASLATTLRVGWMVLAVIVHSVALILRESAVLAFLGA